MHTLSRFLLAAILATGTTVVADEVDANAARHPLEIHMAHWAFDTGEWRTPNPNACADTDARCLVEFGIHWQWNDADKFMRGEITGHFDDGSVVRFWSMFAFHNPVTGEVLFHQIGRGGTLITGTQDARPQPLGFGEIERLDTVAYLADGTTKRTRHENVFSADGSHVSRVFEQDDAGEWAEVNEWYWRLTTATD